MKTEGESTCLTGVLILLMLVTLTTAIVDWPNPNPTIDIDYGPEIETPASSEIVATPWTYSTQITIANITSFDAWRKYEDNAGISFSSDINVPLLNVTEVQMGFSFSILEDTAHVTMSTAYWGGAFSEDFLTNSSDLEAGNHSLTITLPWSESNNPSSRWANQAYISLSFTDCQAQSIELNRFWLQVAVSDSVCPLTLNIERTNGENLYSNAFIYLIYRGDYAPRVRLTHNSSVTTFKPTRVNDTILLPVGKLSASFQWSYPILLEQNFTVQANQSIFLRLSTQFVRVDVVCSQSVPKLEFAVHNSDGVYEHILAYSSPFFYLAPNRSYSVRAGSYDSHFGNFDSTIDIETYLPAIDAGLNRNITLAIHLNWLQIGNLLMTLGRLISLLTFGVIILVSSICYRSRILKSRSFLPWSFLLLSFFIPWLSSLEWSYLPRATTSESYITNWIGSPTFATLIYNSDSNVILMAQGQRGDFVITILLWMIALLIFVETAGHLDGYESKAREKATGIGISFCCLIEFVYLAYLFQTYGSVGLKLEIGPFLSLIAVVLWFLLPRVARNLDNLKLPIQSAKTTND